MSGSDTQITRVSEGAEVRMPYHDVLALAGQAEETGRRALREAAGAAAVATSPDLVVSTPFSPGTALAAEVALGALAEALTVWAGGLVGNAQAARFAAARLATADEVAHRGLHHLELALATFSGREWVTPRVRATDLRVPGSATPPSDLPSLIEHLSRVNDLSDDGHPENNGTIEVQTITGADGTRRHIAYLPGLDDMLPSSIDSDVRDVGAAVSLEAGVPTAYGAGVVQALHDAGVRPGDDVMLVGHSQGGMQAAALAAQGTPYHLTHVVTAGSPAVPGPVPSGVHLLSLEHQGDPLPLADFGSTDGSPQHVTVTFGDEIEWQLFANHGIEHYVDGAEAAQHSSDPVVQQAVAEVTSSLAQPGEQVTSTVFQITRGDRIPLSPAWAALAGSNPGYAFAGLAADHLR